MHIDFSCKHDIYLQDEFGDIQSMAEPYFRKEQIAPGTWLIRSDGDFSYLVEGDNEAVLIDSGYGCGNIREYAQSLTKKPLRNIINTHDHFDHTANNCYFDCAYMSAATVPLATKPFPSFAGIHFPKDYAIKIVGDGFVYDLGGRTLEVIEIPDHAVGSIALLDRKERILFSGDEFMIFGKSLSGSVSHWVECLDKLMAHRHEFDILYAGGGRLDAKIVDTCYAICKRILDGEEGIPAKSNMPKVLPIPDPEGKGRYIIPRYIPHPGDMPKGGSDMSNYRTLAQDGFSVTYDKTRI